MRFETHTVRIGELLGPIDWDYDFRAWGWDRGGSCNPDLITERIAILREIDMGIKRGEDWEAFHGSGRAYRVWNVGMYDGWPYWSPTPSVRTDSALGGGEWHSWFCVSGAHPRGRFGERGEGMKKLALFWLGEEEEAKKRAAVKANILNSVVVEEEKKPEEEKHGKILKFLLRPIFQRKEV